MVNSISARQVARYTLMPEITGRAKSLFMGGLGYVPFFIATVYQMVGLLPRNHPYIKQSNIGRFGVHHVVAEAANNVQFSLKHIDQIILFAAVLVGLVIFVLQFVALAVMFSLQPATAAMPTNFGGFFTLTGAAERQDLAYMMLDMVFGVPLPGGVSGGGHAGGFFESCISMAALCQDNFGVDVTGMGGATGAVLGGVPVAQFSPLAPAAYLAFPFPYHDGLHQLFAVYSNGLLVIAVGITSYFIVTILAETAQSGTPFGRRFNKTWAPIRIVMAFGLLIPLSVGLNSSQYLVLYAAKYGSAFASNGWNYFNDTLTTSYLGDDGQRLVAHPNPPDTSSLVQLLFVAKVCRHIVNYYTSQDLNDVEPPPSPLVGPNSLPAGSSVQAYVLDAEDGPPITINAGTSYDDFLRQAVYVGTTYAGKNHGTIRFGILDEENNSTDEGSVSPNCGEIHFILSDPRLASPAGDEGPASPGAYRMQREYFELIRDYWSDDEWVGVGDADNTMAVNQHNRHKFYTKTIIPPLTGAPQRYDAIARDTSVSNVFVTNINDKIRASLEAEVGLAVNDQVGLPPGTDPKWSVDGSGGDEAYDIVNKGWAGAGIWYNRIAEMNGSLVTAVYAVPVVKKYPATMEKVAEIKSKNDNDVSATDKYKCEVSTVSSLSTLMDSKRGAQAACALYAAYKDWSNGDSKQTTSAPSKNPILTAIKSILGLNGLYNARENPSTHPLAQLSAIGRSLVESSIKSLGYATGFTVLGAVFDAPKQAAGVIASFFVTIAMLGLTVGFVLFYVVPFLPFIYFFFAVGGWVKGIFEALVGAPLWALAHIRIDGHGLPGNAALNGYFLIFEVFLRPILIVFGLLASISTYSALVSVLNAIFSLVTENVGGYDLASELAGPATNTISFKRSSIDEFFYTVIYAILVYMLGMASFKLIDMIPNNILRWMGQSVATFGDQREDPAQGLVSKTSAGSQQVLSKVGGGLQGIVGAATK